MYNIDNTTIEFLKLFDILPDMVCVASADGSFKHLNSEWERVLGYKKEELLSRPIFDFIHPEDHASTQNEIEKQIGGGHTINFENRYRCKDGSYKVLEWRAIPAEEGRLFAVARDITFKRWAEEELKKSERQILFQAQLLQNVRESVVATDISGRVIYWSDGAEALYGYTVDEVMGQKITFIVDQEEAEAEKTRMEEVLQHGAWGGQCIQRRKDGSTFWADAHISLVKDTNGEPIGFIGIDRDITERKEAEEELRQAQKMEAVGTLAGGIAHEFNNMLGIIVGNVDLMAEEIPSESSVNEYLDEIRTASMRAKDVVGNLLNVAHRKPLSRKALNIDAAVRASLALLTRTLPSTIEIRTDFRCRTEQILADSSEIDQIMINLCSNAAHAMDGTTGALEVSLYPALLTEKDSIGYDSLPPGNYVRLVVKDTGTGIEPSIVNRLFDPYFTTKEVGDGLGMGLAVVQGIVKSYGGDIVIRSKVGRGTEVEIIMPLLESPTAAAREKKQTKSPAGAERILFVDDEQALVNMAKKMLERLGYTVRTSMNPLEALDIFQEEPQAFDLVITDLTMPNMTGTELAGKLKQIRDDIPIILCTGHISIVDEQYGQAAGVDAFITKPARGGELAETVRQLLSGMKPQVV